MSAKIIPFAPPKREQPKGAAEQPLTKADAYALVDAGYMPLTHYTKLFGTEPDTFHFNFT